jgi:hypothetical protein
MLLKWNLLLSCTSLLVIALLVRTRQFSLTPTAGVLSMSRTAPGLPLRQARVHHLALLPMVAALPETLDRRPTSRRFLKCGLLLLLLRVLCAHVPSLRIASGEPPIALGAHESINQCPLQVAGLACRLPEVLLHERDRPILRATH